MHRIQEIVRLHRLGQGQRAIARQLRMGRDTVRLYQEKLEQAGLLEGAADDLPDVSELHGQLSEELTTSSPPARTSLDRWKATIEKLHKAGNQPKSIHDYLRLHESEYDGHISSVKRLCQRLKRAAGPLATDVAIRVETEPGEVAQVDFGYAGLRYDPEGVVLRKSWVFVMTLGFSREMYCELVFDQKVETWLSLHRRAFEHFGGVPKVIIPDNLKAAVIRASFGAQGEPQLNRTYRELARHYGFQIDPTPPRAPEKKGKVESNVKYVRRSFLNTWESVDVVEDQRQLLRWLKEIAGQRVHGTTGRKPAELFEELERGALLPMPRTAWDQVIWKQATVHRDSHVQVHGAYYSAPWRLIGEKIWVRCVSHSVSIYHNDSHLHTHRRGNRGQRRTAENHLPEHRRDLRHRSREYWLQRAATIGADVEELAKKIFASDDVLLQLRRVQSVVTHLESFPVVRARNAAARALHFGCLEYGEIKNILRKGLDLEPLPSSETNRSWATGSRYARQATFFSSS